MASPSGICLMTAEGAQLEKKTASRSAETSAGRGAASDVKRSDPWIARSRRGACDAGGGADAGAGGRGDD